MHNLHDSTVLLENLQKITFTNASTGLFYLKLLSYKIPDVIVIHSFVINLAHLDHQLHNDQTFPQLHTGAHLNH